MENPIADIKLVLTILADIRAALPVLAQAAVDLKQAYADKSDPSKAAADVAAAISTVEPLINNALAMIPPAAEAAASLPTGVQQ